MVSVRSKGWLPDHLHWQDSQLESGMPRRRVLQASGDFVGRGTWTLAPGGDQTGISDDRLLFRLSAPLMKRLMIPAFNRAMAKNMAVSRKVSARVTGFRAAPTPITSSAWDGKR